MAQLPQAEMIDQNLLIPKRTRDEQTFVALSIGMWNFKETIGYAWHGSGRRWDTLWLQLVGGLIGGFLFWLLGIKVPQEILDNPGLSFAVSSLLGGVAGVVVIFLIRLCWALFHFRLVPYGGLWSFLHKKLGAQMWPIILMAGALFAFMIFGVGAIWAFIITDKSAVTNQNSFLPYDLERRLREADQLHDILSRIKNLALDGVGLHFDIVRALNDGRLKEAESDISRLSTYASKINYVFSDLRSSLNNRIFNDIVEVPSISDFEPNSIIGNANSVLSHVTNLSNNPQFATYFINDKHLSDLGAAVQSLGQWANRCDQDLLTLRRKIDPRS